MSRSGILAWDSNSWDIVVSQKLPSWQKKFTIPFTKSFDSWKKVFQYKLMHRILPTIKKLCQYGIKTSTLCDYCDMEEESLLHIFCECDIAACILDDVIYWYNLFGYNFTYLIVTLKYFWVTQNLILS